MERGKVIKRERERRGKAHSISKAIIHLYSHPLQGF
jgi:hypothetical protein